MADPELDLVWGEGGGGQAGQSCGDQTAGTWTWQAYSLWNIKECRPDDTDSWERWIQVVHSKTPFSSSSFTIILFRDWRVNTCFENSERCYSPVDLCWVHCCRQEYGSAAAGQASAHWNVWWRAGSADTDRGLQIRVRLQRGWLPDTWVCYQISEFVGFLVCHV